jgi:tRNA-dependent cyclodipeptide synthase
MVMKYFNVTQEEIEKKLFNIFVGISLGNKFLTLQLAKKHVKWAHYYTKDNALILIADKIDVVNWMVFNKLNLKEAEKKVRNKAWGIKGLFDKAIRTLAREENDPTYITKVYIVFWEDVTNNEGYKHLKEILTQEYKENKDFRNQVLYFVNKYIERRGLKPSEISNKDKDKLADYILSELPTLIGGILWNNTLYNLCLYPTYIESGMSQFVLDIRSGKYFDASKLLLRQICVLVEDYLEEQTI